MIDVMSWLPIEKENPVMKTASAIARYLAGVIFAFQVIAAVLLLANRCVPLAVAVLGPVIVNILVFHALMARAGFRWPSS
jgi:hypothetical protein